MQLLLILSAILSTLTGVVTGVRAPDLQAQHCAIAGDTSRARAVAAAPLSTGHRHLLGGFAVTPVFGTALLPVMMMLAPRLYLDRPRA